MRIKGGRYGVYNNQSIKKYKDCFCCAYRRRPKIHNICILPWAGTYVQISMDKDQRWNSKELNDYHINKNVLKRDMITCSLYDKTSTHLHHTTWKGSRFTHPLYMQRHKKNGNFGSRANMFATKEAQKKRTLKKKTFYQSISDANATED